MQSVGIGVLLGKNFETGVATVRDITPGGSSDGILRVGDVIAAVDNKPISDYFHNIAEATMGPVGSEVMLTVFRPDGKRNIIIRRRLPSSSPAPATTTTATTTFNAPAPISLSTSSSSYYQDSYLTQNYISPYSRASMILESEPPRFSSSSLYSGRRDLGDGMVLPPIRLNMDPLPHSILHPSYYPPPAAAVPPPYYESNPYPLVPRPGSTSLYYPSSDYSYARRTADIPTGALY